MVIYWCNINCIIASKINITPKGAYWPISKLHSISALANLLPHNNISQICYCGHILLQSAAVNCSFSHNLTPLGVTFILRAMVHSMHACKISSNACKSNAEYHKNCLISCDVFSIAFNSALPFISQPKDITVAIFFHATTPLVA